MWIPRWKRFVERSLLLLLLIAVSTSLMSCSGTASSVRALPPVPANLMVRPDPPVLLRSDQWKDVLDNLMLNTAIAAKMRIQLDGLIDYLERLNADLAVQRAEQHDDP